MCRNKTVFDQSLLSSTGQGLDLSLSYKQSDWTEFV